MRATAPEPFFVRDDDPPSKREILKAALRLFVRDGMCETTIRAIAAEAGYTNPVLFKFFEGKDELALRLFERCYEKLAADIATAVSPKRGFRENLRAVLERFAAMLDENPDAFLFVQEQLRTFWPEVKPALRRRSVLGMTRALFEQGVREGDVASRASLDLLVAAFAGLLAQFARALYFGELTGDARTWVPELEQLVLKMTRP